MDGQKSFLGSGWSFPPTFSKGLHSVIMSSGEQDIAESLHILFSTAPGERIMQPDYGCDLRQALFGIDDSSMDSYLKDIISVAILHYEPRITLVDVGLDTSNIADGQIFISLDYIVRSTNSRNNIVYPFYKNEGNLVPKTNK